MDRYSIPLMLNLFLCIVLWWTCFFSPFGKNVFMSQYQGRETFSYLKASLKFNLFSNNWKYIMVEGNVFS